MAKLKHFTVLKIKHFVIFLTIAFSISCKESPKVMTSIDGQQLIIDSSYASIDSIANFITPYHNHVNAVLDSTLAYAPFLISKTDGKYNTTAGNLMADIVLSQAGPIFKSRTGHTLNFVLLNHGGIRSVISKGKITAGTAYEVMPFENTVVVAELKGETILKMVDYLIKSKRAHPVAGIQIILNKNNTVHSIKIDGKPLDTSRNYYVATSDYLINGGDNMDFFSEAISKTETDYKIRNAMIDYFSKVDTVAPKVDLRYYQLPE